ncbi:MAG: cytochrome c5 family protein [Chlorobiaceae bacterium]|nr:cytochrome c5 family protein [Chlorobiaceae bacterium]
MKYRNTMLLIAVGTLPLFCACADNDDNDQPEALSSSSSAAPSGKSIYESQCAGCHDSGVGSAPKLGSREDWEKRIAKGLPVMLKNSIIGMDGKNGSMPPKGGNPELSEKEVSAAVSYMADQVRENGTETDTQSEKAY